MTLIAFSTNNNRADILTDTWAYSHGGRYISRESKVYPIPHLDMAYTSQGDCEFRLQGSLLATALAMDTPTFDDFTQEARPLFQEAWKTVAERPAIEPSVVFVIGYSPDAGRFRAYQFASDSDFERRDVDAPFIIPTPFDTQPSELEWARLEDFFGANSSSFAALQSWHQRPALVAPTTVKGWVQLGKHARASRAMVSARTGAKVFVAGDLFHTVLKRGEFRTSRVHTFNDSGPEFAQLVAGTLHPVSQYGPCTCDSGRPYIDCCLAPYATQPCTCGSGKPFQACCSVRAEVSTPISTATADAHVLRTVGGLAATSQPVLAGQ